VRRGNALNTVKYRPLPGTDLKVSEIGCDLGMFCRKWATVPEPDAVRWIYEAFDRGVTLFDASEREGDGYGEELIAKALGKQRDELVLATKVGYDLYTEPSFLRLVKKTEQNFSPALIKLSVDHALRRLKTDRIDILQLHHPGTREIESDEVWDTLDRLKRDGKILSSGVALKKGGLNLRDSLACLEERKPAVVAHDYNLLQAYPGRVLHSAVALGKGARHREALAEAQPTLVQEKPKWSARFFTRDPLASGLLETDLPGTLTFREGDPRGELTKDELANARPKVRELLFLTGSESGRTLRQAAVLWLLAHGTTASCLVPADRLEELLELIESSDRNPLTRDELERVAELQQSWLSPEQRELVELE
jgi:aryl-alcohol dehydrogenase-like predicted oxidoreductase